MIGVKSAYHGGFTEDLFLFLLWITLPALKIIPLISLMFSISYKIVRLLTQDGKLLFTMSFLMLQIISIPIAIMLFLTIPEGYVASLVFIGIIAINWKSKTVSTNDLRMKLNRQWIALLSFSFILHLLITFIYYPTIRYDSDTLSMLAQTNGILDRNALFDNTIQQDPTTGYRKGFGFQLFAYVLIRTSGEDPFLFFIYFYPVIFGSILSIIPYEIFQQFDVGNKLSSFLANFILLIQPEFLYTSSRAKYDFTGFLISFVILTLFYLKVPQREDTAKGHKWILLTFGIYLAILNIFIAILTVVLIINYSLIKFMTDTKLKSTSDRSGLGSGIRVKSRKDIVLIGIVIGSVILGFVSIVVFGAYLHPLLNLGFNNLNNSLLNYLNEVYTPILYSWITFVLLWSYSFILMTGIIYSMFLLTKQKTKRVPNGFKLIFAAYLLLYTLSLFVSFFTQFMVEISFLGYRLLLYFIIPGTFLMTSQFSKFPKKVATGIIVLLILTAPFAFIKTIQPNSYYQVYFQVSDEEINIMKDLPGIFEDENLTGLSIYMDHRLRNLAYSLLPIQFQRDNILSANLFDQLNETFLVPGFFIISHIYIEFGVRSTFSLNSRIDNLLIRHSNQFEVYMTLSEGSYLFIIDNSS